MRLSNKRFYVYVLERADGSTFYVGKGSGPRFEQHEIEASKGCSCKKCEEIRAVWGSGCALHISCVFESDNEQEAYKYEASLIAQLGIENLANKRMGYSLGADGPTGIRITVSEEEYARIRVAAAYEGISIREFVRRAALENE
jgi:hypothetical protein